MVCITMIGLVRLKVMVMVGVAMMGVAMEGIAMMIYIGEQ